MDEARKSAIVREYLSKIGSKGGMKKNPFKGFGTGDNARKAVNARWERYRARKKQA